jgi:hypothetical protein
MIRRGWRRGEANYDLDYKPGGHTSTNRAKASLFDLTSTRGPRVLGRFASPFLGPEVPLLRPLEAKKPKSPLTWGAFPPLGGRAIPARTVFWAFFPKNGLLAGFRRLACKAGDRKGTNSSSERGDEVGGEEKRTSISTTTEEAPGQKFVPKGEFLTSPQPGEPGFWVDFRPVIWVRRTPYFDLSTRKSLQVPSVWGLSPL